ncbi:FAD-dependent oxidoreductase [Mycobacterium sp. CVI_P3]|uniref:FAD-dependent oxidoreductase n=1 Tax=Mycobacterium pinniadriaticum TaxID=2994102 RepID=A0ABT3SA93_9MYCO|nr:FAD-dependent oxidoreductase [Mycobacterium pinniadriaticum]MCX2930039.1 FAD-dependent oxidoreductase [Mycobacterium pinniadriaticum]MCX2936312.1 FAD-dependent oxidoreductase [Mycobacterium pinniadriaticum]
MTDVIVVGGGPSGLAAAHRLTRSGLAVRLLESSGRIGGKMSTTRRDGYVIDDGAFFIPSSYRTLRALAAEIGMADELVPGRFVLSTARDGVVHDLDGTRLVRSIIGTGLLSVRGKAELAKLLPELARARVATYDRMPTAGRYDTQSLNDWARAHLSAELQEYLTDATMRGIFATSGDTASRVDFLAIITLFAGAGLLGFRDGMASFPERLSRGFECVANADVHEVEEGPDGVTVSWTDANRLDHIDSAAGCVVATPAEVTAKIVVAMNDWRRDFLMRVRNGHVMVVNIGLGARPPQETTYIQVPRSSHPFLTGILFDHHKAPGRAPANKGLLTLALLDSWSEDHRDDHDDEISATVLAAVDDVVPGLAAHAEFTRVTRWRQEFNTVGCYRDLGRFRASCRSDHRVQLAGDSQCMQNIEYATTTGLRAADRLLATGLFPAPRSG